MHGPVTVAGREVRRWRFLGRLHGEREGWTNGRRSQWRHLPTPSDGHGGPVCHRCGFEWSDVPLRPGQPVLLRMDGMGKGVTWLHEREIGRYWQIGPQRYY